MVYYITKVKNVTRDLLVQIGYIIAGNEL